MTGMGSHQATTSKTNTWFTPMEIIEALGGADSFDLDPCSHVDRPFPTARRHFTAESNGLIKPWFGRVWCNPPYSNPLIGRFMARMADHNRGTALIFARTETATFAQQVWPRATAVLFIRGRLTFIDESGKPGKGNAGAPSVLIAYGEEDAEILRKCPIAGKFIRLKD